MVVCLYTHALLLFHPLVFFFYSGLFFATLPSTFSSSVLTACLILYSPTRKSVYAFHHQPHLRPLHSTHTILLLALYELTLFSLFRASNIICYRHRSSLALLRSPPRPIRPSTHICLRARLPLLNS
ncbi:hypothetical protein BJ912DRAFT_614226 [Pholiota molesta]|nr:hypothetical protein BJ912DRAFT_614226 [Pholiota molesta]